MLCKIAKGLLAFFLTVPLLLLALTGCDAPPPATVALGIQGVTQGAVTLGLNAWAQKGSSAQATQAAQMTVTNGQIVLAWLQGNPQPVASDVFNMLNTTLIKGLDPVVVDALQIGTAALDASVSTSPTASSVLSANEILYIQAFVQGAVNGANAFLAKDLKAKDIVPVNFLTGKPQKWVLGTPVAVKPAPVTVTTTPAAPATVVPAAGK
jgi:hypothetical protein